MNRELFEAILGRFGNQVSGEQLLTDIANQVRLPKVRQLLGSPVVTPLDVFRTYRDQNERVAAKVVAVPGRDVPRQGRRAAAAEVQALYDKYKDVLPDPRRDTPGFKVPRQVKVEILSIDGNALARGDQGQAHRGRAAGVLREPQGGVQGPVGIARRPLRRASPS